MDGETVETVTDFVFLGSKITADGTTLMEEGEEEIRNLWMKVKADSEKAGLKFKI